MTENKFSKLFEEADALFDGKYSSEIEALHGITIEEIKEISGEVEGIKIYSVLLKVVEQASKDNLSQAELGEHIKELGSVAVKLAKKVPGFAGIFK